MAQIYLIEREDVTSKGVRVITTQTHFVYIFKDRVVILERPSVAAKTDSQTGY